MRIDRLIDLPKFGIIDIEHNNGKIIIFAFIGHVGKIDHLPPFFEINP